MNQWSEMYKRFNEWGSPLRPCREDVTMFSRELLPGKNLLLGVTSELIPLVNVAADNDPAVIQRYPNKAILADWAHLPFGPVFNSAIGDGCLNAFQGSQDFFFESIKKVLKPGGRLILRTFISPEHPEPLETVFKEKHKMGFHAFKWRVAHSIAQPTVQVQDLYRIIKPVWDHPTLSIYEHSPLVYYFPKLSQLPRWTRIQFGHSYELCERCPVITWTF